MEVKIRFANLDDLDYLIKNDDIEAELVKRKIEQKEVIVAELNNKLIAFLRLEFLWSKNPYIAMIRVDKEYQKQGIGKSFLKFLEDFLKGEGHKTLFSSSQEDEKEPQEWHKKMGFEECGYLDSIPKVREIFFFKKLRKC